MPLNISILVILVVSWAMLAPFSAKSAQLEICNVSGGDVSMATASDQDQEPRSGYEHVVRQKGWTLVPEGQCFEKEFSRFAPIEYYAFVQEGIPIKFNISSNSPWGRIPILVPHICVPMPPEKFEAITEYGDRDSEPDCSDKTLLPISFMLMPARTDQSTKLSVQLRGDRAVEHPFAENPLPKDDFFHTISNATGSDIRFFTADRQPLVAFDMKQGIVTHQGEKWSVSGWSLLRAGHNYYLPARSNLCIGVIDQSGRSIDGKSTLNRFSVAKPTDFSYEAKIEAEGSGTIGEDEQPGGLSMSAYKCFEESKRSPFKTHYWENELSKTIIK